MSKRTWRWVTRDKGDSWGRDVVLIWTSTGKPKNLGGSLGFKGRSNFIMICVAELEVLFPTIKPGQCIKVEFSGKVIP